MNAAVYVVVLQEVSVFRVEVLISAREYQHVFPQTMALTVQIQQPRMKTQ
jgi:hypothetical protein